MLPPGGQEQRRSWRAERARHGTALAAPLVGGAPRRWRAPIPKASRQPRPCGCPPQAFSEEHGRAFPDFVWDGNQGTRGRGFVPLGRRARVSPGIGAEHILEFYIPPRILEKGRAGDDLGWSPGGRARSRSSLLARRPALSFRVPGVPAGACEVPARKGERSNKQASKQGGHQGGGPGLGKGRAARRRSRCRVRTGSCGACSPGSSPFSASASTFKELALLPWTVC